MINGGRVWWRTLGEKSHTCVMPGREVAKVNLTSPGPSEIGHNSFILKPVDSS